MSLWAVLCQRSVSSSKKAKTHLEKSLGASCEIAEALPCLYRSALEDRRLIFEDTVLFCRLGASEAAPVEGDWAIADEEGIPSPVPDIDCRLLDAYRFCVDLRETWLGRPGAPATECRNDIVGDATTAGCVYPGHSMTYPSTRMMRTFSMTSCACASSGTASCWRFVVAVDAPAARLCDVVCATAGVEGADSTTLPASGGG